MTRNGIRIDHFRPSDIDARLTWGDVLHIFREGYATPAYLIKRAEHHYLGGERERLVEYLACLLPNTRPIDILEESCVADVLQRKDYSSKRIVYRMLYEVCTLPKGHSQPGK